MKRLFCCLMLLWLAACAGMAGLSQKPEVSLAGLDLLEFGLIEQRFALKLRIRNPNDVALSITGVNFAIELDGQPFASGVSDKAVTVPRQGDAVLEVTATSNLSGVLKQLREFRKGGRALDYRLTGRIAVDGLGSLPFERKGELAMPRIEPQRKPSVQMRT